MTILEVSAEGVRGHRQAYIEALENAGVEDVESLLEDPEKADEDLVNVPQGIEDPNVWATMGALYALDTVLKAGREREEGKKENPLDIPISEGVQS